MRKTTKIPGEKFVKDIKRATRKQYSSKEKIRIVLDGLRGEDSKACTACSEVWRDGTTQPKTHRENRSMTTQRYAKSSCVRR